MFATRQASSSTSTGLITTTSRTGGSALITALRSPFLATQAPVMCRNTPRGRGICSWNKNATTLQSPADACQSPAVAVSLEFRLDATSYAVGTRSPQDWTYDGLVHSVFRPDRWLSEALGQSPFKLLITSALPTSKSRPDQLQPRGAQA